MKEDSGFGRPIGERVAPTEEWRIVPGLDGRYSASTFGRVRGPKGLLGEHLARRYLYCCIRHEGRATRKRVHGLIALTFLGPRPAGHEVDHIDRNRFNNHAENLRYVTPEENAQNVTPQIGAINGRARLTEEQAVAILALPRTGKRGDPNSLAAIAARYGVGKITIADLFAGRTWEHLERSRLASPSPSTQLRSEGATL